MGEMTMLHMSYLSVKVSFNLKTLYHKVVLQVITKGTSKGQGLPFANPNPFVQRSPLPRDIPCITTKPIE
eukprot:4006245-Amphidinium_carterae.1